MLPTLTSLFPRALEATLAQIHAEVQPLLGRGKVADYIPALAQV